MSSREENDAEELMLWMEQQHGAHVWQQMWDIMHGLIKSKSKGSRWLWEFMNTTHVRCACVWAPGDQSSQQSGPVTPNEPLSIWWPVLVSTDPAYVQGDLFPVLCLPLLEGGSRNPWPTHRSRIVVVPAAVADPPAPPPGPPPGPRGLRGPPPPPPHREALDPRGPPGFDWEVLDANPGSASGSGPPAPGAGSGPPAPGAVSPCLHFEMLD